ncbi:MAG TPA: outer membrane lipoprotein carrier protein LolA [Bacteroidia bacterium]
MKRIFFFYILFSIPILMSAQFNNMKAVADIPALKSKLEQNALNTENIRAEFKQEKHLSILEEVITSTGTFLFKKENKVRWNYIQPFNYLIIINGDKIHINDEGKQKSYDANSSKMFGQINKIVVGTAKGTLFSDPDYITQFKENSNYYEIYLVPKNNKLRDYVNEIYLYIDKKDLTVYKLKMVEKNGDFTLVEFLNKKVNQAVQENEFRIP